MKNIKLYDMFNESETNSVNQFTEDMVSLDEIIIKLETNEYVSTEDELKKAVDELKKAFFNLDKINKEIIGN